MYSMVMMMAMSGTAAVPASCFGKCHGSSCNGAVACSCSGYSSCSGSCSGWSSCSGSRCSGGLFSRSCHGSRCSGYSSCSGYTSCSGSCSGYSSCSGSCSGWSKCSGSSCSCSGHRGLFRRSSCHGSSCSGYSSCSGSCSGWSSCNGTVGCTGCTGGTVVTPAQPSTPEKKSGPAASLNTPAKVLVSLPADAKLSIDGHVTTSNTAERTFVSPALEAGKEYQYTLTAELVRDGKNVTESKTVIVRAGETTSVNF